MENSEPRRIPVTELKDMEDPRPVKIELSNRELWLRELESVYPEAVAMLKASGWVMLDRALPRQRPGS
jgi:hypothetical protein